MVILEKNCAAANGGGMELIMTVQTINKSSIAVFLDLEELNSQGIGLEEINANRTMLLAKQAFKDIGLQVDGELEVEAYINTHGVMVFASVRDKLTDVIMLCSFTCFEDMLACVQAIAPISMPRMTLIYLKNVYYLALHEEPEPGVRRILDEFGESLDNPSIRFLHLTEHGEIICYGNAVNRLTRAFGDN